MKRSIEEDKVIKGIITGNTIPKSVGLIELEKNYALLADVVTHLITKIEQLETDICKLERIIAEISGRKIKIKHRKKR